MPRFFFDIDDGDRMRRDEEGSDHADLNSAQLEATDTLTQMARELFPGTDSHGLSIIIREETGPALMQLSVSLVAKPL